MFMWSKAPSSTWYNNYNDNCIWKCFFVNNNYLFVVCIIFSSKTIKAFDCCCWCSIIIIWEMSNCCWLCFCCCYITFSMLACCCCICICCFLKTSIFSLSSSWCSFLIFRSSSFSWSLTLALSAKYWIASPPLHRWSFGLSSLSSADESLFFVSDSFSIAFSRTSSVLARSYWSFLLLVPCVSCHSASPL